MEIINGPPQDATEIFQMACKSFRDDLPVASRVDFKEYLDAQTMIDDIHALANEHPVHKSKLTVVVHKIHQFAKSLEPYFEIVNIFVQVRPDYMGLIWGSLMTIFKLSANYVTFLEKVADMFASISRSLPAYEEYVDIIQARSRDAAHSYPQLGKALAYVYVDILRFCYGVCERFSQKRQGWKSRASFIGRITLMSVRESFSDVLKALEDHKKLLELELSKASTAEAMKFYTLVERRMGNISSAPCDKHVEEEIKDRENKARELRKWINPPPWADSFEQAQERRADGTCDWILKDVQFNKWRSQVTVQNASLADRTLSIQARPGFGKTVLCARVIERLGQFVTEPEPEAKDFVPSVFYFFFDGRREGFNKSADALRAITAQLLHLNRKYDDIVMIGKAIQAKSDSGEQTATDKEVVHTLKILLHYLDISFLIFDGLDECLNYQDLLKQVKVLDSNEGSFGLLLSSRINIQLPTNLTKCFKILPSPLENADDIARFLRAEIQEIADEDIIPTQFSVEEITKLILARSNGMFLWVKLLTEYLRLPVLTKRERREAIRNLNRLEGLDALYRAILKSLGSQFPQRSHNTFARIFGWVAFARRPLYIDELRVALAIRLDSPHCADDEIPDFKNIIGTLTGSLIEVGPHQVAQFIHLSAHEYVIEEYLSNRATSLSSYVSLHQDLAAACLSYLCYSVAHEPLSGDSRITPDATTVGKKYPFLSYSAGFWWVHLFNMVRDMKTHPSECSNGASYETLTALVTLFVEDKRVVTMATEASWLFHVAKTELPEDDLEQDLSIIMLKNLKIKTLALTVERVLRLLEEVITLNQLWSHVVFEEPNEIWEPSIPAFKKSRFLIGTSQAQVNRIALNEKYTLDCITMHSRISESGSEVGVVRLFPPCGWQEEHRQWDHGSPRSKWEARYELWSLLSNQIVCSVGVELQASQMHPFIAFPTFPNIPEGRSRSDLGEEFEILWKIAEKGPTISLPVAISDDVCRAVILDTVVDISLRKSHQLMASILEPDVRFQIIDFTTMAKYVPFRADIGPHGLAFEPLYHLKFSPCGKHLVAVKESTEKAMKDNVAYGILWLMQVFTDKDFAEPTTRPRYTGVAGSIFFSVPEIACLSPCRGLTFHPTLPWLAFPQVKDGLPQTFIWDFLHNIQCNFKDVNPFPLHEPAIVDPYFVSEGDYICGTDAPLECGFSKGRRLRDFCTPLIVKTPEFVTNASSVFKDDSSDNTLVKLSQSRGLSMKAIMDLAGREKRHIQRANSLVFEKDSGTGVIHVSQLNQIEREGAVILRAFGTDGKFKAQTLTRLPNDVKECVDVSLLHSVKKNELYDNRTRELNASTKSVVYVVLNKAHQKEYTAEDIGSDSLPAIIERKKESIPSFINSEMMISMEKGNIEMDLRKLKISNDV